MLFPWTTSSSSSPSRTTGLARPSIIALFFVVMILNLLVMRYARPIVRHGGVGLQILGAVLGVLPVALALQMILNELRFLRVVPTLPAPGA